MEDIHEGKEETKDRLLDEAERLFADKGFPAVSVREITSAAKTNQAAVNYHFGGKKNLYLEVFRSRWIPRASSMLSPRLEELKGREDVSADQVVRVLARSILDAPLSDEESLRHGRLITREFVQPTEALELVAKHHMTPMIERAGRLLAGTLEQNVSKERIVLYILSIIAQGIYFSNARMPVSRLLAKEYNAEMIARLVDHITDFALHGLKSLKG
ncbi:MAG: CerR family C-terminal domain-containing protein [Thermodesulfobacteriota bacterium]|nr:CerR family C-terminal domain-containing protein [Thermodesulfobacteriota bacterium]